VGIFVCPATAVKSTCKSRFTPETSKAAAVISRVLPAAVQKTHGGNSTMKDARSAVFVALDLLGFGLLLVLLARLGLM
jgi:hypothetical protein